MKKLMVFLVLLLVPFTGQARPEIARPQTQRAIDLLAPSPNTQDRVLPSEVDTLFLFASTGPGSFGGAGTDERGFTFDDGDFSNRAGWTSTDVRHSESHWHLESTEICAGSGTDMAGAAPFDPEDTQNDYALWCGRTDVCGWYQQPGYGNHWDCYIRIPSGDFEESANIAFEFMGDYEGDVWDNFSLNIEIERSSGWRLEDVYWNVSNGEQNLLELDVTVLVEHFPNALSFGDWIFRFTSDGAWSDEDGLYQSDIGAVWIDNIVASADGVEILREDFESGILPPEISFAAPASAGDFAELYSDLFQEDPSYYNPTHAWAFFDIDTMEEDFPVPVIVHGPPYLENAVDSPILDRMHPLGDEVGELFSIGESSRFLLQFWVYLDLPSDGLVYYSWDVAAQTVGPDCLMAFRNDNQVHYGDNKSWFWFEEEVTDHLLASANGQEITGVVIRLSVIDMCPYWCGIQYAPHRAAPYFDNIRVIQIRDVQTAAAEAPPATELIGVYPNPFNPETAITFNLEGNQPVRLAVYDIGGRQIRLLFEGTSPAGMHTVSWDGRGDGGERLASGVYFLRFRAGEHEATEKLVLLK